MAIKATYEVTVIDQTDAKDLVTWYQLSTSATKPSKPTTTSASAMPTGWTKAEPTYNPSQGTKYLYTCQQLVWGDGTCGWGEVQLSSSYEAAKAAANAAAAASASASAVADVIGTIDAPYTEVEWVESNGKQYVYLDWKPPIATWGFEADFQNFNAVNTSGGGWNASTNKNGYGGIFGTINSSGYNDIRFSSYNGGYLRIGGGNVTHGFRTDKTRQTIKLHGTTLTKSDGTTATVARTNEAAGKPYANMTLFCWHNGIRRGGTGNLAEPGSTRIYSLKFFDGNTLEVDLVGALRKSDGVTGLYDKVAGHFYPAPGMTFGDEVGDLGEPDTFERRMAKMNPSLSVNNLGNSRMWRADAPMIDSLEDGQQITVTPEYSVGASVQTTELAGWDDTTSNYQVYLKLTLSDGSETDWIPCWYSPTGRLTTHYGAGMPIRLAYRENACVNSTATATTVALRGWFADPNYDTGNTTYTKYSDTVVAGKNGLKRYTLCMRDDADNWTSIVNEANNVAVSGKTCYTGGLKLGAVSYHATGAEYAAGANAGAIWESYGGVDFRYSVNGVTNTKATTLQFRKPVYLVGTIGEDDGLFYLDTTDWWTQAPNDSTKVYVLVGTAFSTYNTIFVAAVNPAFVLVDGELVEYDMKCIANAMQRTKHANYITAEENITAGHIVCGTSTGYKHVAAGVSFDISYPLLYAGSSITATNTGNNNYLTMDSVNASTSGTIEGGAANKRLYLKGVVSGRTFTVAGSPYLTTVTPSGDEEDEGVKYAYLPLGIMYSATNLYFESADTLYSLSNNVFQPASWGAFVGLIETNKTMETEFIRTDAELSLKADAEVTYTKEEVDGKFESSLTVTSENILSTVSETYVTSSQYEDEKAETDNTISTMRSEIDQRADQIEFRLVETDDNLDELTSWVRVSREPGLAQLELGSNDSEARAILTNERLNFMTEGQPDAVAYIGSDEEGGVLGVTRARIGELNIANDDVEPGYWQWQQRQNGNLALKWIATQVEAGE